MSEAAIQQERATNLWNSAARKLPQLAKATKLQAAPNVTSEQVGGLRAAHDEVMTYACGATMKRGVLFGA